MIKLFRRIRQRLLSDTPERIGSVRAGNRISKYILYAVGEILLVIIGILIALQINNANELRKNKEKFTDLLKEVLEETIENIKQTDSIKYHYDEKLIIVDKVLNNKVSYQDFEANYDFFYLINYEEFQIFDDAYKNLIKITGEAPSEYKEIIKELKRLYGYNKNQIDKGQMRLEKTFENYVDYSTLNNPSHYTENFAGSKPTKGSINYRLRDTIYKNFVFNYKWITMQKLVKPAVEFQVEAIEMLKDFEHILVEEDSRQMITSAYQSFKKEYKDLPGIYKGIWYGNEDIIKIFEENDKLYMSYGREKMPIKIYSKNEFLNYSDSYLYKIGRDENGAIQAIFYPNGTIKGSEYLKIQ